MNFYTLSFMTTGELAKRLGVHINTIRLWTGEYAPYLSESAVGKGRTRRNLSDRDALILATVASLRNQGLTHDRVVEALDNQRLVEALPELPSPEETEARERIALIPIADLHRALDRVQTLQTEIEAIRQDRDRGVLALEQANAEIARLQHELGTAQGRAQELEKTTRLIIVMVFGLSVIVALAVVFLVNRG